MASGVHLRALKVAFDESITGGTVTAKTPKLAPMATSYTPNFGTDEYWDDISASLASGASLITLTSWSINIDTGNARVEFDAADVSEASQTFSTDKFSVILDTGTPSTSPILATIDNSNGTVAPVDGTYAITFNAEGIFAINDN